MTVAYYGMETIDESTFSDLLHDFMINGIDNIWDDLANGFEIELRFKSFLPGAAETADIVYTISKSDDSLTIKSIDTVVGVVTAVTAGVAAGYIAALLAPALFVTSAGIATIFAGIMVFGAVEVFVAPVFELLYENTLENYLEYITGTLDDEFVLYGSDGVSILGGALYKEGLGTTSAIDAAADLVREAYSNPALGTPALDTEIRHLNDVGSVVDVYKFSEIDIFSLIASVKTDNEIEQTTLSEVQAWNWAEASSGETVSNTDITKMVGPNSDIFM